MGLLNIKTNMIYSKLLNELNGVNSDVLKQVSIYLASTLFENESYNIELKDYKYEECCYNYVLTLSDGRRIFLCNDLFYFGFLVSKYDVDNQIIMSTVVSLNDDTKKINIYGTVKDINNGVYIVTFRPNNIYDSYLKYGSINYYTMDEVEWIYNLTNVFNVQCDFDLLAKENFVYPFAEKSFFEVIYNDDIEIDYFNGYINNVLTRVDLLYNNVRNVKVNKLVKTK